MVHSLDKPDPEIDTLRVAEIESRIDILEKRRLKAVDLAQVFEKYKNRGAYSIS